MDDLRDLALDGEHPRTRERFLALYEIAIGTNATQISRSTARNLPNRDRIVCIGTIPQDQKALRIKKQAAASPLFVKKSPQA